MAQDSALAHARSAPAANPPATGAAAESVRSWLDRVRPADFGNGPPR